MSTTVYWASGSAPAWRVLLALETKQIAYESRLLELSSKEHKRPEFLALNPRGQVPVLSDDGVNVCEASAILHYLEYKHPTPELYGKTSAQAARIEQACDETLAYLDSPVTEIVRPVFRNKVEQSKDAMASAAEAVRREFERLDSMLADSEWLADDHLSAADIVLVPTLQRLLRATQKNHGAVAALGLAELGSSYPGLSRWNKQVEALPAFDKTFPPHWRD